MIISGYRYTLVVITVLFFDLVPVSVKVYSSLNISQTDYANIESVISVTTFNW